MRKPTSKNLNGILDGSIKPTSRGDTGPVTSKKLNRIVENELVEDWGSSDWTAAMDYMNGALSDLGAVNPENIEEAARQTAEFYHENMGYDRAEDAVDSIIGMYMRRSGFASLLAKPEDTDDVFEDVVNESAKLDRHGRIDVAHWGSDDENETGTVKAQLRKFPPKRNVSKKKAKVSENKTDKETISEMYDIMKSWGFYKKNNKNKLDLIDYFYDKESMLSAIKLRLKRPDVSISNKHTDTKEYYWQYNVLIFNRKSDYYVIDRRPRALRGIK